MHLINVSFDFLRERVVNFGLAAAFLEIQLLLQNVDLLLAAFPAIFVVQHLVQGLEGSHLLFDDAQ